MHTPVIPAINFSVFSRSWKQEFEPFRVRPFGDGARLGQSLSDAATAHEKTTDD